MASFHHGSSADAVQSAKNGSNVASLDPGNPEALSLTPAEIRRLGYEVVDVIADHWGAVRDERPAAAGTLAEVDALLREPLPAGPSDPGAVLRLAVQALLGFMNHADHPLNFARVPGPSNPVGVLGDMLVTGLNATAMSAAGHPGATAFELLVLDWLAELIGFPSGGEGVLLSGGSVSSLTAFAVARHAKLGHHDPAAVAYLSEQTHTSMARALRVLGFADDRVRTLPIDDGFRLQPDVLDDAAKADRAAGLRPFCVVATAGTTNTGAVDPLGALADVAADHGIWLHVDGSYGAPAAITPRGAELLSGIERADSLTLDPHKWLFTPYEIGVLLVREPGALSSTFHVSPEYLRDLLAGGINLRDRGPQLTRSTRAVKLWMTLKTFGADAIRAGVEHGILLAERAEARLRATPGWRIVTPAQMAVVTFAHERVPAGELVARADADGRVAPSSTLLRGDSVLRLCTINPRTSFDEIEFVVDRLTELADS